MERGGDDEVREGHRRVRLRQGLSGRVQVAHGPHAPPGRREGVRDVARDSLSRVPA